jgi:magnesium chelatase subunit D
VLLAPTGSVELARMRLKELPTGGATPLAHGIKASLQVLDAERKRDQDIVPWLVLVTDGRANVALNGGLGSDEARSWASRVREERIHSVVIDTDGVGGRGAARDLAVLAGGSYVRLGRMDGTEMAGAVREALVAV